MIYDKRPPEVIRKYGVGIFPPSQSSTAMKKPSDRRTLSTRNYKKLYFYDTSKDMLWQNNLRNYSKSLLPKDIRERPNWQTY